MASHKNYDKYKYLINTKINNWTILDLIVEEDKHHVYVKAQCDCGTIRDVRLSYLMNNKIKDCGCGHQQRLNEATINKYEYLLNTTINNWTILQIIPPNKQKHNTYALCQCQCGTVKEVKLSYILNGKSRDCGCTRKNKLRDKVKDLTGQKFGKLTVIEMLDDRNKYGRIMYRCACDCGNNINVLGNSLTMGHTLSCGCLISYWNMYIKKFLDDCLIKNKTEYKIYVDGHCYRFDFYLPDYNLFIEYDGEQHYRPVRFHGNDLSTTQAEFEEQQKRDKIKNKYCEDNNIHLLRIPYWETKNIETIITNHLQRLNEKDSV